MNDEVSIIRKRQVLEITGLKDSTIRRLIDAGEFPAPIQLGPRCVGFYKSAVLSWINSRPAAPKRRPGGRV